MEKVKNISSGLAGVAGEYFVAGELSRNGFNASITLRNTKGVDIICSNEETTKSVNIQVKTNKNSSKSWILSKKCETNYSDNLFYVFVNLNNDKDGKPEFFVVPSKIVAEKIKTDHSEWLNGKKKDGTGRKDSDMRKFEVDEKYKDSWEELGL